jgi:hypothetical protein
MPLIYTGVYRTAPPPAVELAEAAGFAGNFADVALELLNKAMVGVGDGRYCVPVDGHSFIFQRRGTYSELCTSVCTAFV